ncbi:unnamed protein product [Toxocara canis]|uniref:Secreted protein n=1 Tax=Toxocara canis TaxID=6265 RepID=A0A183UVN4_TOXCA|nr:unnamed protein product [Toxocara canis]
MPSSLGRSLPGLVVLLVMCNISYPGSVPSHRVITNARKHQVHIAAVVFERNERIGAGQFAVMSRETSRPIRNKRRFDYDYNNDV